jgi:hypothetical protein
MYHWFRDCHERVIMALTISFAGEPLSPAKAHHRPCFLSCKRIDGSVSFSDIADCSVDTIEVTLEGKLTRLTTEIQMKTELICCLRGFVTTWVKHGNPRAIFSSSSLTRQRVSCRISVKIEYSSSRDIYSQILHMTDVKPWQGFVREVTPNGHVNWSSAFHFEIPQIVFEPFPGRDEDFLSYAPFLALPPSVSIRTVDFGGSDFELYDQGGCHVVYALCVQSISKDICIKKSHLELDIFPRASPLPPLDIQDFPGEYRLTGLKALYKGLIPKKSGVLTVGTREPQPLELCQHTDTVSTKIALDFRFQQSSNGSLAEPPIFSDCDVTTILKVLTFISTSEQMSAPTMQQSTSSPSLVRIVRCASRQTHKFLFPNWYLSRHDSQASGNNNHTILEAF